MTAGRLARRAVVAALSLLVALSACRSGAGDDRSGGGASDDEGRALCRVVGLAQDRVLAEAGLTFTDVVDQDERTELNATVSALILLSRERAFDDDVGALGPYEAAIAYLNDRGVAWDPEFAADREVPERTAEVRRSAQRLDADLAAGACR